MVEFVHLLFRVFGSGVELGRKVFKHKLLLALFVLGGSRGDVPPIHKGFEFFSVVHHLAIKRQRNIQPQPGAPDAEQGTGTQIDSIMDGFVMFFDKRPVAAVAIF